MDNKIQNLKKYDAWLHWHVTNQCNLDCEYCSLKRIDRSITINIDKMLNTLNQTNKTFNISFTGGGEPFFATNLIEACQELTKKHFVSLVTNLTSNKVKEFANKIDHMRVLVIIASVHVEELQKNNLFNVFCENFLLLKNSGFEIKAQEVAHPKYLDVADKYRKLFYDNGIELKFSTYIGRYKGRNYPDGYSDKELSIFGLNKNDVNKHYQYKKICNAGYNAGVIDLDGNVFSCYHITKKIGNIYDSIEFKKNLVSCPSKLCACPLNVYDPYLFNIAMSDAKNNVKKYNFFQRKLFHKNNFYP